MWSFCQVLFHYLKVHAQNFTTCNSTFTIYPITLCYDIHLKWFTLASSVIIVSCGIGMSLTMYCHWDVRRILRKRWVNCCVPCGVDPLIYSVLCKRNLYTQPVIFGPELSYFSFLNQICMQNWYSNICTDKQTSLIQIYNMVFLLLKNMCIRYILWIFYRF